MEKENNFSPECELCGGYHDLFDITGCFNNTADKVLKENPHHFDRLIKRA